MYYYPGQYSAEGNFPIQYNGEGIVVLPNKSKLDKGEHMSVHLKINGTTLILPTATVIEWKQLFEEYLKGPN